MMTDLTLTQQYDWRCGCGATWPGTITIIADLRSRLDLMNRALADDLQCAFCPKCNAYVERAGPLLLVTFDTPPLVLAIPDHLSPAQQQRAAEYLVGYVHALSPDQGTNVALIERDSVASFVEQLRIPEPPEALAHLQANAHRQESNGFPNEALASWLEIIQHPAFADAGARFRASVYSDIGALYLDRHFFTRSHDTIESALKYHALALGLVEEHDPDWSMHANNLALALHNTFHFRKDPAILDRALQLYERSLRRTLPKSRHWLRHLNNYATGKVEVYEFHGDKIALDEAINCFEQCVSIGERPFNLANSLVLRYSHSSSVSDLDRAIDLLNDLWSEAPNSHVGRALGSALLERHQLSSVQADLDRAFTILGASLKNLPADDGDRNNLLNDLASALLTRFKIRGVLADLERAISIYEGISAPGQSISRASTLRNLAIALTERYIRCGDARDMERAASCWNEGASLAAPAAHERTIQVLLAEFAYDVNGDPGLLDRAIADIRAALHAERLTLPHRTALLNALGAGLRVLAHARQDLATLQEAARVLQEAIQSCASRDFRNRVAVANNIITVWSDLFTASGTVPDFESLQNLLERDLDQLHPNDSIYGVACSTMGTLFHLSFNVSGNATELDKAIEFGHRTLSVTPAQSPGWCDAAVSLASSLNELGTPESVREAVELGRMALPSISGKKQIDTTIVLGNALRSHFENTGDPQFLEEAVRLLRNLVALPWPLSAMNLANLSMAELSYFEEFGNLAAMESAVENAERAHSSAPAGPLERSFVLSTLASALVIRHSVTGSAPDLARAVTLSREALVVLPPNAGRVSERMANIAGILNEAARLTRAPELLEESLTVARAAVATAGIDEQARRTALHNLGSALVNSCLYRVGSGVELSARRREAIQTYEDLLTRYPGHDHNRARFLANLGVALRVGFHQDSEPLASLERSMTVLQEAVDLAPPHSAVEGQSLSNLGGSLIESWRSNGGDHGNAVRVFRRIFAERFPRPVVALQAGRNWARWALERDSWNEAIEASTHALSAIGKLLESHASRRDRELWLHDAQDVPAIVAYSQMMVGRLDEAVVALENGHARLLSYELSGATLHAMTITELQMIAAAEPIIYLAACAAGGFALMVFQATVEAVLLPELTKAKVTKLLIGHDEQPALVDHHPAELQSLLPEIMDELRTVMLPLLAKVSGPVRFVACGQLMLLPIHAVFNQPAALAPSARALRPSDYSGQPDAQSQVLIFADPRSNLRWSRVEAKVIAAMRSQVLLRIGDDAARSALLESLPASVVHLSCHGRYNFVHPELSSLELAGDELLSLGDLFDGQYPIHGTRLITLSACQSAATDIIRLPDESLGLPVAFLQAGVTGVVATLWPINDFVTAILMTVFYQRLWSEAFNPRSALYHATRWLETASSDAVAELLEQWRGHVDPKTLDRIVAELRAQALPPFRNPFHWAAFVLLGS